MSHADLTGEDRALLVRIGREHALKAVSAAIDAVLNYSDLYRQEVAHHLAGLNGPDAWDVAAESEPYRKILHVCVDLGDAKRALGEVAG
jgi:hypothetical protein